jgi:hypothetical protein
MKFSVFRKTSRHLHIGEPRRNQSPAYTFMVDCFLRSRTETGNPSNVEYDEEDVNVYIVNLLCLLMDPVYYLQVHKYVANNDVDIFRKIETTMDNRLRYWVYKANADYLLVNLGLFDSGDGPGSGCREENGPLSGRSARADAERGKTYYNFARSYCCSLAKPSRAVASVLGKLSYGFETYVTILDHMRGEYFNIMDTFSEGEMFHLQRELDRFKNREIIRDKYDLLLDLYLEWKKTKDRDLIAKMEAVLRDLKALDPSCSFKIPERTVAPPL